MIIKQLWTSFFKNNYKNCFNNILNIAEKIISNNKEIKFEEKEHPIFDFINSLATETQYRIINRMYYEEYGNSIKSVSFESMFFNPNLIFNNRKYINDLFIINPKFVKINLAKDIVFSSPYRIDRFTNLFSSIGGNKLSPWKQTSNYRASLYHYLPINIGFVHTNGNHSITVGINKKNGEFEFAEEIDIRKLYDYVKCDGEWYSLIKNGRKISKCKSPFMGAIFEIGRLIIMYDIKYKAT